MSSGAEEGGMPCRGRKARTYSRGACTSAFLVTSELIHGKHPSLPSSVFVSPRSFSSVHYLCFFRLLPFCLCVRKPVFARVYACFTYAISRVACYQKLGWPREIQFHLLQLGKARVYRHVYRDVDEDSIVCWYTSLLFYFFFLPCKTGPWCRQHPHRYKDCLCMLADDQNRLWPFREYLAYFPLNKF